MNGKCDLCALKVVFDQDITRTDPRNTEVFFAALRDLQKRNIVGTGYSKSLSVSNTGLGDKSEVCAVNSPQFGPSHKERVCPHFILNMGLSVPEALALNTARNTDKLTVDIRNLTVELNTLTQDVKRMTGWILLLTVIAIVVAIFVR